MKTRYIDLIEQTFDFPQEEFQLEDDTLKFHDIYLMDLVKQYGTPLKFSYLPKISENIRNARVWFKVEKEKTEYQGKYFYFATPMDLKSLDQLDDAGVRDKTLKMIEGYYAAFSGEAG